MADYAFGSNPPGLFGMTPGDAWAQADRVRAGGRLPLANPAAWFDATRWVQEPLF